MIDEQAIWDALEALLAAGDLSGRVYDYGDVPGEKGNDGTLPDYFALLSVSRRYAEPNKPAGTGRTGWRISVQYVDRSTANARLIGRWVRDAFETTPGYGKRITVDGMRSTPLTHETTRAVEPDEDRFSGSVTYTFAL